MNMSFTDNYERSLDDATRSKQQQPEQQQHQPEHTTRAQLLARLAQQQQAGINVDVVSHDWSTRSGEVSFDDTEWARPDSSPLAGAVDLQGRPTIITGDTNPDEVIVQVRGIGMRLSNALKLGLLVDDVHEHLHGSPAATPSANPAQPVAGTPQPEVTPQDHAGTAEVQLFDAERSGELSDAYDTLAKHGIEPNSFALDLIRGGASEDSEGVQMLARDTNRTPAEIVTWAEEVRSEVVGQLMATVAAHGYDPVALLDAAYTEQAGKLDAAGLAALSSGSLAPLLNTALAFAEQRPGRYARGK